MPLALHSSLLMTFISFERRIEPGIKLYFGESTFPFQVDLDVDYRDITACILPREIFLRPTMIWE